jgi:molybdenum cofactor biosynthesis enzyme MoaA
VNLQNIGFYTLSDARAACRDAYGQIQRAELVLTARCNFRCPYCQHVGGPDLPYSTAHRIIETWLASGLKNVRFSGGEPTLYPYLTDLVTFCRRNGVERIAVSTNGSADWTLYERLIAAGVNDFSVSLDACCAEDGDLMAGGIKGAWAQVTNNIRRLAFMVYTTVGVVLTNENRNSVNDIIRLAHDLGVADIRIIPAAQFDSHLGPVTVDEDLLQAHPILRYRLVNVQEHRPVRGLCATDSHRCGLVLDDVAVMGDQHYPCIIYMREGGAPIGPVDDTMRTRRLEWQASHDTHADPICRQNCLDVCVAFNNARSTAR